MRGIQLHQAAFHHLFRLFLPANAQELLSAGDSFYQQFQNLIQDRFICRIALFQNFQFQSLLEIAAVLFFFLWIRATFPRFRYDQVMRLGWKVFIPVCLIWLLVVGCWMMSPWNIWK